MKNINKFFLVIPIAVLFYSFSGFIPGIKIFNPTEVIHYNFGDDYKAAWHKVDSLVNEGLTRSALEVVEGIYKNAKTENNQPQIIKSLFYKLKFTNYTEEDSHVKVLNDVKNEIKTTSFPANAILKSILANIYWQYYQNNRYRFQQRTETVNFDNDDFQTWDLPHLIRETVKLYQASLEQSDSLKLISIKEFEDILNYGNSGQAYLRPTLFDLLAHQALSFYINDEASVTDPVYKFELNNEDDFSSAANFIDNDYTTKDSLSLKFYAIKLYQEIIEFHLDDDEKDALIDVDLARLNFVRRNSVHTEKENLYIFSIIKMEEKYNNVPYSSLISFNKAKYYYDEGVKYNASVSDAHKWEIKKALEICNTAIEKFPDTFGAQECRWLQNLIIQKSLQFQTEYGNIPDQPFRSLITYKNSNKIYIRVIPWNETFDKKEKNLNAPDLVNYYKKHKAIREWSLDLPDDNDYQQHTVEIKMPELPAGRYLILSATEKNFSYKKNAVGYSKIWVSNLSYIRRDIGNNTVQIYAVDRESGHPLANVDVDILLQKYFPDDREYRFEKVADGTTDDEGLFEFTKEENSYGNYKTILQKGSDRFESQNYYSYYYGSDPGKRRVTHFFLDRAIYRPGQVVYFKGLMLETDGKKDHEIITDHKTTVTFYDANSQKISDVTLTTNEYGTFNGQFTIPYGKIGGQYYVMNEVGSQYFRVEEYKRPKFEVKFEPVKGSYSLNDEVTATGFAKTYSGVNLNDVEVKYRVVRNVSFPYFYYAWRGYYNWYWGNNTEMEITNGVTGTDKEGKFKVEFELIPDLSIPKKTKPVFNYTVYADVVDVTSETHSAQTYVSAGYVALVASINLPEIVNNKLFEKYSVSTTNLNGQFESAKVSVDVYKLKTPSRIFRNRLWTKPDKFLLTGTDFYEIFAHDIYDEENQFFNWGKDKNVFQSSFTTSDSSYINFEDQDDWKPGKYVVTLKTKDKNGTPVELIKYFTLFDPESDKIPLREPSWIYLEQKNYEPGETAVLYIGSAEEDVKAL